MMKLFAAVIAGCVLFSRALAAVPLYETSCVVVDATTVEGYVTNPGAAVLTIAGPVRFVFDVANSMSRPTVQTQASALIPPGGTVRVARAQMAGTIMPSEACRFDVTAAVR